MDYKRLIEQIEYYKTEYRNVFHICCDHGMNPEKEALLLNASSSYVAVINALFDFLKITDKKAVDVNAYSSAFKNKLENQCKDIKLKFYIYGYVRLYEQILRSCLALNASDAKRIKKYITKEKNRFDNNAYVNLTSDFNKALQKYKEYYEYEKSLVHVGEEISDVDSSKYRLNYNLILFAIEDGLLAQAEIFEDNDTIKKRLENGKPNSYYDEDDYAKYKSIHNRIYQLGDKTKRRLNKYIKENKIK